MLESGAALHASPRLLARLADALSLSGGEPQGVVHSGASLTRRFTPSSRSLLTDMTASVAPLRTAARRLLSATNETGDTRCCHGSRIRAFRDADFVGTFRRIRPGEWHYPAIIGGRRWRTTLSELHQELFEGLTPGQIDEVMLHGSLTEAGQVGTRPELHRNISVKQRIDAAFESAGFEGSRISSMLVSGLAKASRQRCSQTT